MSSWRCGFLLGTLLLAAAPALTARETPQAAADKKAVPADAPPLMPPADVKTDPWKLPGGAIIEITPEKYQELLDKIARLKANAAKPAPPSRCTLLKGRIENGFVLFTAQFDFHADRADAVFALACGQAKALAAQQQDGRTPMLSSDATGFLVQVEKPGDYVVSLDLSLPLTQRAGGSRGFELDLPRAVVTKLEMMDLPADARAIRLGGKDVADTVLTFKNGKLDGPLGTENELVLSWRGAPAAGVAPLQTARGRVLVHAEEGWLTTDAELVLHASGGPVGQWVVNVPAGAELKAAAADQQRVQINRADEAGGLRYTVLLKEPSDDDLTLTATVRTPLPTGKRAPVGPFLVRGASRQSGVVLVSSSAPDARLILHPHAELTPRELTDEERRADPGLTAAYDYGVSSAKTPWLEVEAGPAHGAVKVQTVYALALGRTGTGGMLEWQVTTTISALAPVRAGIDHLDVQVPAECEVLDGGAPAEPAPSGAGGAGAPPSNVQFDKETRIAHLQFGPSQEGSSAVSFKARYHLPPPGATRGPASLTLPLPRPLQISDGGARIDLTVPDDVELLPTAESEIKEAHKLSWHSPQCPEQVAVACQPYRPEIHVSSVIDVTLHGQTAQVKHELRLRFPRTAPKQLTLRTPAAVAAGLQVVDGGALTPPAPDAPEMRTLLLQGAEQEQVITLQYSFAVPSSPLPGTLERGVGGEGIAVPLATIGEATGGETKVRILCDAGPLPLSPGGAWTDQNIEEVKGVNRLPVLVLKTMRPDAPLTLRLGDPSSAAPAAVLIDRALVRASLGGDLWVIHTSDLLRQLGESNLDVQLPGPPSALQLRVTLDGRQVDWQAVEESDQGDPNKHVARLRLAADLVKKPAVLEIVYQVSPGRGAAGVFQTTLTPPRLVGDLGQAPTRWEVTLPPGWLALSPEVGAAAPWTVAYHNLLLTPQIALSSADLERWFAGSEDAARGGDATAPSLVCWEGAGEAIIVAKVWQPFWLLLCSLAFLALGLRLFVLARQAYAGRKRAALWFWCTAVVLVPVIAAVWVLRPTLLYAIAYGCEPGAAVLLVVLTGQCLMLERYRRQIVFLPNFRRARTGSSLLRANGLNGLKSEPSTVDVPRTAGSSQKQG
jgi:hypothetical protein